MTQWLSCCRRRLPRERLLRVGRQSADDNGGYDYAPNTVRNQKYSLITFLPMVLYEQFKFFLNFYFLLMALSQFIPAIRVGYVITYWGPLGFVLAVTLIREAFDDFYRFLRDREMNREKYLRLTIGGSVNIASSDITVGDIVVVHKNQRVPADLVLLRTSEKGGACFLRTDQLDGETDWKLRVAVPATQMLDNDTDIFNLNMEVCAEKPQRDIHGFAGTTKVVTDSGVQEGSLNVDSTMWANTVLASGTAVALVIYTGRDTRSVMNASQAHSKVGILDLTLNNLTKVLFLVCVGLSFALLVMKGFEGPWYRYFMRFILLFSYIIPISLRVNLDMAKVVYSWMIGRDKLIPGTVVRSSTIPEELGRISYLLSDKTGTLTKNEMIFKKIHLGTVAFGAESFEEVEQHVASVYSSDGGTKPAKFSLAFKVQQSVEALALCHNVTPIHEEDEGDGERSETEVDQHENPPSDAKITYQAASPDEVALVEWTESVGVALVQRDLNSIQLRLRDGQMRRFTILQMFPFTSESKRMGIIIKDEQSGDIEFLMKGADTIMKTLVQYNDWLEEECSNMAREGLRTLVVAKKRLTLAQYQEFEKQFNQAKISMTDRSASMAAVLSRLEKDLVLLCLTGVEDSLQDEVRPSLEHLRNAGVKVWMLTGDKQETALCIAKASGLFGKMDVVRVFGEVLNRLEAHAQLNLLRHDDNFSLVISGAALKTALQHYEAEVAELVTSCAAVVCCRCSPEQKAQMVHLLRKYCPDDRIAAIGDGGNDVSMIQAAHAGIGIEAKEGRQASLAADFSLTQFSHLQRLLLVHGRHCYKRSCSLSQFVMHRGLIISTMQAIFSCVFFFASVSLYQGVLMVAYSTVYTCFPVFSIVMDKDVKDNVALTYPELYKELRKGRSLSYKTFFIWFLISVYQGAVIMYGALIVFDQDFIHIVSISFTALIITELIMVALTIHTWHWLMLLSELVSIAIYVASLFLLPAYFDVTYMLSATFLWKTVAITAVSCVPLYIAKFLRKRFAPPTYSKVN